MTQPGRASIEVVGDLSKLGRQLKDDAQKAVDNLDLDTSHIADEIGGGFEEAAERGAKSFDEIDQHFEKLSRKIQSDSDHMAKALTLDAQEIAAAVGVAVDTAQRWIDGLQVPIARNRKALVELGKTVTDVADKGGDGFRKLGRTLEDAGDTAQEVTKTARRGLASLTEGLISAATAAGGFVLSGINPAGLVTIALFTAAIIAAIPVVIGLAAALADLAGLAALLPSAIGVLVSALVVGKVAFQGFGEAIQAVIDGDPEKIAEALKKLAPAAREVVKEFQVLLPQFRKLGDETQQALFVPLRGALTQFVNVLLPTLSAGFTKVGSAIGNMLRGLADIVSLPEQITFFNNLLDTTADIINRLSPNLDKLLVGFLEAANAALPTFEDLSGTIGDALGNFGDWLAEAARSGELQQFLDDALATLGEIKDLIGAVGELFGVLFEGTDEGGRSFIETLTDLTKRLTEFFKSAEGQDALQDFEEIMGAIGVILGWVVNIIRFVIDVFTDLDDAIHATGDFFSDLWDGIVEVWNGITTTIGDAIDKIQTWFSELPGKIVEFVQSIPDRVAEFFNMLVDKALDILAFGIAAIIVFFTDLPGQINIGLALLWEKVVEWFTAIKDKVLEIVGNIVTFFQELPGKIAEFLETLPGRVAAFFQRVYDSAVEKLTALVNWVKGLPQRILDALGDLGRTLYESGKKIIQGLINGISDKIGDLKRKIAEAVQNIRDHLPFSPAKTGPLAGAGSPEVAGAKIAAMIAAGLDSGASLIAGAASRSAGAVADAGLTPLTGAAPGASPPVLNPVQVDVEQQPMFVVMIGDEQIDAHIERVVDQRVQVQVRRLMAGTRGA